MEPVDTPARENDLQTVPMGHIHTDICNTLESSNKKQEPGFDRIVDVAKFSEHSKYSGNVANIIDIKTEVNDGNDYHSGNLNNAHGPTHSDDTIVHHIPGTTVTTIKPEPGDETNINSEFVIEIDTCKDEYCEKYGYPTNGVNANLQNSERDGDRLLCTIDTQPCIVGLTDIRNTYPHIITQRSVHIHGAGLTSVIDGTSEASVTDQMRHANSIKINKMHVCQVCGAAFPSKSKLNRHTSIHTGVKPYTCSVCGVGFTQKGNLEAHIRIHTGEKPHKCSVCVVSFTQRNTLIAHMRTHTGEKPYRCSVCEVGFRQKHSLKIHKRIHTGEKPNGCSVCGVGFTQTCHLIRHMQIHTGEKPYKCTMCGIGFARKGNLKTHLGIHTGEKPHKCPVCERRFREKSKLKNHMRIHTQQGT